MSNLFCWVIGIGAGLLFGFWGWILLGVMCVVSLDRDLRR